MCENQFILINFIEKFQIETKIEVKLKNLFSFLILCINRNDI